MRLSKELKSAHRLLTIPVVLMLTLTLGAQMSYAVPDLTAQQKSILTSAESGLKRVETNLKLAQDTAGPGTGVPAGSKAKLALVRLGSAAQGLPAVQKLLEQLPSGDVDVESFRERYSSVSNSIEQLDARLTGKAAPAGGGQPGQGDAKKPTESPSGNPVVTTPKTENAPTATRLDYRQEEKLKNARYYLREIAGHDTSLKALVENVKTIEDASRIDYRTLLQGMNTIARAREREGYIRTNLEALPADGKGVAPVAEEFKSTMESVDACEKIIAPLHQQVAALINIANYPEYGADFEKLRELSMMFANPNFNPEDADRVTSLINEFDAVAKEQQKIAERYAILARQETEEGRQIMGAADGLSRNLEAFRGAMEQQKTLLPSAIQSDLVEVNRLIDEAVADQKPLYFSGGIPSALERAEQKVLLLTALDESGAKAMNDEVDKSRTHMIQSQASLRDVIIETNSMPSDNYKGADRGSLEALAMEAWKNRDANAKVLSVRIPSQEWKREVLWRNQTGTWYKIDRSKLQVQLIVQHDDKLAEVRPINLWKDHLSQDHINAFPFHSEDDELQPQSYLLLNKVK